MNKELVRTMAGLIDRGFQTDLESLPGKMTTKGCIEVYLGYVWILWDWIDHQDNPEELWDAMWRIVPWAHKDDPTLDHILENVG